GRGGSGRNNQRGAGSGGTGEEVFQTEGRGQVYQTEGRAGQTSVQVGRTVTRANPPVSGANPPPVQPEAPQLAAAQVDNTLQVGARGGRAVVNRVQTPARVAPQAVTQPAGNGNRLDVTRSEKKAVLMLEARNPAQPSAVVHRSLITK